jgi:hypothetical protein
VKLTLSVGGVLTYLTDAFSTVSTGVLTLSSRTFISTVLFLEINI